MEKIYLLDLKWLSVYLLRKYNVLSIWSVVSGKIWQSDSEYAIGIAMKITDKSGIINCVPLF